MSGVRANPDQIACNTTQYRLCKDSSRHLWEFLCKSMEELFSYLPYFGLDPEAWLLSIIHHDVPKNDF